MNFIEYAAIELKLWLSNFHGYETELFVTIDIFANYIFLEKATIY